VLAGAAVAADAGALALAIVAGIVGAGLLGDGLLAFRRAGRSRVGAVSEARVRRALGTLRAEGWRVAHGVSWRGRGDIDHVICSPNGLGFAIETKTRRYSPAQLERTAATARWLGHRRRRFPRGVLPVLCVVYDRRAPVVEHAVRIVSLDCLLDALRAAAVECPTSGGKRRVRRRAFGPRRSAAVGLTASLRRVGDPRGRLGDPLLPGPRARDEGTPLPTGSGLLADLDQ